MTQLPPDHATAAGSRNRYTPVGVDTHPDRRTSRLLPNCRGIEYLSCVHDLLKESAPIMSVLDPARFGGGDLSEFALETAPPFSGVGLSADLQAQALYIMWSHTRASRACP